jgi:hypothetical protein
VTPAWARYHAAKLWCSVLEISGGSVLTRCRGRWSAREAYDVAERPTVTDRCVACQQSYAAAQLDRLAASCGDVSQRHAIEVGLRELAECAPA